MSSYIEIYAITFQKLQEPFFRYYLLWLNFFSATLFSLIKLIALNGGKKKYSLHFLQVNLSCVIPKQEYLVFAHRFIVRTIFIFFLM